MLTQYHHSFRNIDATYTQAKTGMVAHLVGVHTLHVNTVIILDDDCYYYHSWRNNVVTAFGTLVSLMYHEYHVKPTPEQRKLNSLKSESKGATNKTPTCMVPAHAP